MKSARSMYTSPRTSRTDGTAAPLQALRNVVNGAQIGGDVLADRAVAARRALHEQPVLVAQVGRQTVDLGFRDQIERHVCGEIRGSAGRAARTRSPRLRPWRCRGTAWARGGAPCRSPRPAGRRPDGTGCPRGSGRESAPRSPGCAGAAHRSRRPRSPAPRRDSTADRDGRSPRRGARVRPPPRSRLSRSTGTCAPIRRIGGSGCQPPRAPPR